MSVTSWTGLTLAHVDARSWLGRTDGAAPELGVRWRLALRVDEGPHHVDADGSVAAAIAAAPEGDDVVAGAHGVSLDVRWVRRLLAWFGPYVRAGARSSLLGGRDDREAPTRYRVERPDGSATFLVTDRLALTDPLLPVTLHQSVGAALRPVRNPAIAVDLLAGVGGRQTFADGQRALADDPATATVEVLEARDAAQLGVVGGVWIGGELDAIALVYRLRLDTSFPLVHTEAPPPRERRSPDATEVMDPGPMDLASLEAGGLVAVRLAPFVAIGHEFEVVREPLVLDAVQFRSSLRLSFGAPLGERPAPRR